MRHDIIQLNKFYPLKNNPILQSYYPTITDQPVSTLKRAMLVIPGGGYGFCSEREKDPICLRFALLNYVTFSLTYSVASEYETPLYPQVYLEVLAAVDYIKEHALEYGIDPTQITLIGFSAGGHLASSYPLMCKDKTLLSTLSLDNKDLTVESLILSYPVISLGKYSHLETSKNLTGDDLALKDKLSANLSMDKNYPRTFIWTTKDDDIVPYENSLMLVEALEKNHIPYQFKLYESGPHGLSLATYDLNNHLDPDVVHPVSTWVVLADKFIKNR